MSISFSEDAQQEVVTSSRVLPEDSGEGSLRPRLLKDYTGCLLYTSDAADE